MVNRILKAQKWELRAVEHMNTIAKSSITLSFKLSLNIEDHAFGTLEPHHNGKILSFGEILVNDTKCALPITDLNRFQRGKHHFVDLEIQFTEHFNSFFDRFLSHRSFLF